MDSPEELQREFDAARRELEEMADEIADVESRMTALARQDVQLGDLREMLADARRRHHQLEAREGALRANFSAATGGARPNRTH